MKKIILFFIFICSCSFISFEERLDRCLFVGDVFCNDETLTEIVRSRKCSPKFSTFINESTSVGVVCYSSKIVPKDSMPCVVSFAGDYICFKRPK